MGDIVVLVVVAIIYGIVFWNKNRNEEFIENLTRPRPQPPERKDDHV